VTETVDLVIRGANELITCRGPVEGVRGADLKNLECITNGAVAVDGGRIVAVGPTAGIEGRYAGRETLDATGRLVSPGLVDPHSHLLYAGSRHDEWEFKVTGDSLETDIEGGIHRSVAWTRDADDASLVAQALDDLDVMALHGTTTLEAKTGYGLTRESELHHLALIAGLEHAVDVVATFLAPMCRRWNTHRADLITST
jgi:imidazolonepropionase